MKTIKRIADEIGVSKQAVEKRIARQPLRDALQGHITKDEKGINRIDAEGELLIKDAYEFDESSDFGAAYIPDNLSNDSSAANEAIQTAMAVLMQQLEAKDRQIAELSSALATAQRTALAAQRTAESAQLLHAGTMRAMIETSEKPPVETPQADETHQPPNVYPEPGSGFWARVFGRRVGR